MLSFLVGLLLGASALTLCELIDFLITLSVARMCKREKPSTNQAHEGPKLWPLLWNMRYETFDTLIIVSWPVAIFHYNIYAIKITEKTLHSIFVILSSSVPPIGNLKENDDVSKLIPWYGNLARQTLVQPAINTWLPPPWRIWGSERFLSTCIDTFHI